MHKLDVLIVRLQNGIILQKKAAKTDSLLRLNVI